MMFEYKVDHIRKSDEDFAGLRSLKKKKKSLRTDGVKGSSGFSEFCLPTVFDVETAVGDIFGHFGAAIYRFQWVFSKEISFPKLFLFFSSFSLKTLFPLPSSCFKCWFEHVRDSGLQKLNHG